VAKTAKSDKEYQSLRGLTVEVGGATLAIIPGGSHAAVFEAPGLKPTGNDDEVRLGYWSHRRKWEDVDDMGGVVMPLDEALAFIANEGIFWTWT